MIRTEADFLDAVADYIEQRGWCRGQWRTAEGAVCPLQAMADVATLPNCAGGLYTPVINRFTAATGQVIVTWNDWPLRTKQEVLDLLRELAKAARREEDARL